MSPTRISEELYIVKENVEKKLASMQESHAADIFIQELQYLWENKEVTKQELKIETDLWSTKLKKLQLESEFLSILEEHGKQRSDMEKISARKSN